MAKNKEHEILLIEHDETLRARIESVLTGAGYKVQCKKISLEGLSVLEEKEETPFSLVISSFKMPKMTGEQVLENAKLISPMTQRMIITDPSEIETVIGAVNKAEVHGCLSIPFTDENLLFQVGLCLNAHDREMKRINLISVTERQNRQMYKLAKTFKSKADHFSSQIEIKKKQIRIQKSRYRLTNKGNAPVPPTLAKVLEIKASPANPKAFVQVFETLSKKALTILNRACSGAGIKLEPVGYEAVKESAPHSKSYKPMDEFLSMLFAEIIAAGKGELNSIGDEAARRNPLENYIEFNVSEDRLTAFAQLKKYDADIVTVDAVKECLSDLTIEFGVKEDALIKTWLSLATPEGSPFVIAQGTPPEIPVDARVSYHFQTDFLHAGKVQADGSMNFRERGNIPFVTKDSLLGEKISPREGKPGVDISGLEIPVSEAVDIVFNAGQGARASGDGLKIYADCDGQPHLDPLGNVSVFSELNIKGDVDFETGNINFKGNIVVGGVVKEGFSVRGATLTAGQIEGAEIVLTGDLNVSGGIIDAKLIRVQGSVQAKYVNNSFIRAFGDLLIQKEIIDSTVFLTGECVNQSGNIIASTIVAKKGVKAVQIGTEASAPSRIRVGVDDHINQLMAEANKRIKTNLDQMEIRKNEIAAFEAEDQVLHMKISDSAHIQDRSQVELGKIEVQMLALKDSNDLQELDRLSKMVRKLHQSAKEAEAGLDAAFERQDALVREIQDRREQISFFEEKNKALAREKLALVAFSKKTESLPQVIVAKRAMPETTIEGPNTVMKLKNIISRSRIVEVKREGDGEGGLSFYEMVVSSL